MSRISPLLRELIAANRLARAPSMVQALRRAGLRFSPLGGMWGLAYVEAERETYQPHPDFDPERPFDCDGQLALITGVWDGGGLFDLVATSLRSRAMRRRTGNGCILGEEAIEEARWGERPLIVHRDALSWISNDCVGVVILDWPSVPFTLADLPHGLVCQTDVLARRIRRAFERPVRQPPLYVSQSEPKDKRHAA